MELSLDLGDEIYEILDERAQETGFDSTEEYCRTILELFVAELEPDDQFEEVEDRLEDLGYLS